ncbi:MAG: glycosyltransferase [Thiohalocapsa sp.]
MTADAWPPSLHLVGSKALGGAERWLQRFAVALAERGAEATVGVRVDGALAGLDMGGLTVRRLPFLSVWDPISRHAVTRLVRQLRPAIVQTYMGRATRLTRLSGTGVPVHVARLGGYYKLTPYRHADAWIGNTRGLCDWMVGQGLPAARVYHIYNFINAPRLRPKEEMAGLRTRLDIPEGAWVMAALGRLVPVKGHAGLLKALSRLPKHIAGRPWRFVLVGDGPLRAKLEMHARELGIFDRLRWAGWQRVPGPYLQLADLIVFPSQEAETLGNVILEAWAWRRPLVTTEFRGAREIARHAEDAWCVPCDEPTALANGVMHLLGDSAMRDGLVERGAERVVREFSQDAIMAQYLDLYGRLVGV